MWPWEHAVVGYLAYSLFCHAVYRDSPGAAGTLVVVFASVLPDLIDKPLAWQYGVFETGYALGHSVFFAVPLAITVGWLARTVGRPRLGVAFGLGYLLHLPADVLPAYVTRGEFPIERILWPVRTAAPDSQRRDFLGQAAEMIVGYWQGIVAGELSTYEWGVFGLSAFVFALWLYDGAPVLRELLAAPWRLVGFLVRSGS